MVTMSSAPHYETGSLSPHRAHILSSNDTQGYIIECPTLTYASHKMPSQWSKLFARILRDSPRIKSKSQSWLERYN